MTATIENLSHLTGDEAACVRCAANGIRNMDSLERAANELKAWFDRPKYKDRWFVYEGGSHVALHRKDGDTRRILLVTA